MSHKRYAVVSWIGWTIDYLDSRHDVNPHGPNFDLHRSFYGVTRTHSLHLLLSTRPEGDPASLRIASQLERAFPEHEIKLLCLDIPDIYDFGQTKEKTEFALEQLADFHEIDILFSSGTSTMRTVWLILHLEKNQFHTHLIQGIGPEVSGKSGAFIELEVDSSLFAHRIRILSRSLDAPSPLPLELAHTRSVYERARKIADVDQITTLIEGDSGTGKEVLAKYIHHYSRRRDHRMITVNCAAMNNNLLESRLFGFLKHSFTDAKEDRDGFFHDADRSSLFLDEIGDITPYMQQALLRVLQEREVTRVGGSSAESVDVRIIAATNKTLRTECEEGRFRWDLYYRLTQTRLLLPPLWEYPLSDKRSLIDYFLDTKADLLELPRLRLSKNVEQLLLSHTWPGNLRELENLIVHCYVFAQGEVQVADLPEDFLSHNVQYNMSMETAIHRHARKVYNICEGNKTRAAGVLGISTNSLTKYLKATEEE